MPTPKQKVKAITESVHNFEFSKDSTKYLSTSKSNILTYTIKSKIFKFRMEINNFFTQQHRRTHEHNLIMLAFVSILKFRIRLLLDIIAAICIFAHKRAIPYLWFTISLCCCFFVFFFAQQIIGTKSCVP